MENQLAKIAISISSEEALTKAFDIVNLDFDGGRVSKADLASWLISQGARGMDQTVIQEIRQAHFNQVKYLENLVKKMKASGRDSLRSEEIADLQSLVSQQATKKRNRTSKPSEDQNEPLKEA
jgi:hypothetical protein